MFIKEKSTGLLDRMKARSNEQKGVNAEDIVELCEIVNGGIKIAVNNNNAIDEIKKNQEKIYNILKNLNTRSTNQLALIAEMQYVCAINNKEINEHKMFTNESLNTITQALSSTDEALADLCSDMDGVYEDFNKLGLVSDDEIWVRKTYAVQEDDLDSVVDNVATPTTFIDPDPENRGEGDTDNPIVGSIQWLLFNR
jgi:hypothetical protein